MPKHKPYPSSVHDHDLDENGSKTIPFGAAHTNTAYGRSHNKCTL